MRTVIPIPSRRPATLQDLDPAEQLIVRGFRRWVSGSEHWPLVARDFRNRLYGAAGDECLQHFMLLIALLRRHARRVIRCHQPHCPCLAADEICLLTILAATQWDEGALAEATASWLVEADGVGPLLVAATALAGEMAHNHLVLPERLVRFQGQRKQPGALLH